MLDPPCLLETGTGKHPNTKEPAHLHHANGLAAAEDREFRQTQPPDHVGHQPDTPAMLW